MIRKRLANRRRPAGQYDPRLVLVAEGQHDVYRLGRALEAVRPTSEGTLWLHELGRRVLRTMDQQEPGVVRKLQRQLGPAKLPRRAVRGGTGRLQLRLGLPVEELRQLEEAVR